MKEWGLYSMKTGGLIMGLGLCTDEEDAWDMAWYYADERGWDISDAYVAERQN